MLAEPLDGGNNPTSELGGGGEIARRLYVPVDFSHPLSRLFASS